MAKCAEKLVLPIQFIYNLYVTQCVCSQSIGNEEIFDSYVVDRH